LRELRRPTAHRYAAALACCCPVPVDFEILPRDPRHLICFATGYGAEIGLTWANTIGADPQYPLSCLVPVGNGGG